MDEIHVISSESSHPDSPVAYEPTVRVKDLCKISPSSSVEVLDSVEDLPNYYDNAFPYNYEVEEDSQKQNMFDELLEKSMSEKNLFTTQSEVDALKYSKGTMSQDAASRVYHSISDSEEEDGSNSAAYKSQNDEENFGAYIAPVTEEEYTQCSSQESKKKKGRLKVDKDELLRLKEEKEREKAEKKAQKLKEKEQKMREKVERKASLEKRKRMKPGECKKYLTTLFDNAMSELDIFMKALSLIQEPFNYKFIAQEEANSVTWIREVSCDGANHEIPENTLLLIWPSTKLVSCIKYCTLLQTFKDLKNNHQGAKICLVVVGLTQYIRKLKAKEKQATRAIILNNTAAEEQGVRKRKSKDDEMTVGQIEMGLTELEVCLHISSRLIDSPEDLSLFIQQFTKAVSEIPYRKEIELRDMGKSWYVKADSRNCVRVDKDFNGLNNLWVQQLCQFNKTSIDIAKAIAEVYPTPLCLYEAYKKCSTQTEKEVLIKDIQIKRGSGPGAAVRRVGPELSKKLCLMFSQSDGEVLLSQEQ